MHQIIFRSFFILILSLFTLSLASCHQTPSNSPSPATTATPTTTAPIAATSEAVAPPPTLVIDQTGRQVTITARRLERIVSLSPANTEILFALGLGQRVVGVTEFCDYPPEALEKPKIGGFSDVNIEAVVASNADLVLASPLHAAKIVPQLETRGIKVIILDPKTFDEVLAAIDLVGSLTEAQKEAALLKDKMLQRIRAVTDKTGQLPDAQKPRVFYVVWHDPLMTAGAGTFMDELINKAGGTNIAAGLKEYATIDLETVLAADPQIMIAGVGMGTGADLPLQYLKDEARLADTSARKNGLIFGVNQDIVGRAGPRLVEALEELARIIHPELLK